MRAISWAKKEGMKIEKACNIVRLPRNRYYRWLKGGSIEDITTEDLKDRPPVARIIPHKLTPEEREIIIEESARDKYAELRHRKLAYTLMDRGLVVASPSSFYRTLKDASLVKEWQPKRKPKKDEKPNVTAPNRLWHFDITFIKVGGIFLYLIAILDRFSRKITGWELSYSMTVDDVKRVFSQALASEGLLEEGVTMPLAYSDNGTQMRAKSLKQFFKELGIKHLRGGYRSPEDNGIIEVFFKTVKYEHIYLREEYQNPLEAQGDIARFIDYYNNQRLHQGIGFVTPRDKHTGVAEDIYRSRKKALEKAREKRININKTLFTTIEEEEPQAIALAL